jgi:hypothetical protein
VFGRNGVARWLILLPAHKAVCVTSAAGVRRN